MTTTAEMESRRLRTGNANGESVGLGYSQITSLSSAVGLGTIPAGATRALITVEGQPVRWRDDGTNPTTSVGMPLAAGDIIDYDGNLSALKFIETASGAKLNVYFYG